MAPRWPLKADEGGLALPGDSDGAPGLRYPRGAMRTPSDTLYAFYLEHRRCGELDGDVEDGRDRATG